MAINGGRVIKAREIYFIWTYFRLRHCDGEDTSVCCDVREPSIIAWDKNYGFSSLDFRTDSCLPPSSPARRCPHLPSRFSIIITVMANFRCIINPTFHIYKISTIIFINNTLIFIKPFLGKPIHRPRIRIVDTSLVRALHQASPKMHHLHSSYSLAIIHDPPLYKPNQCTIAFSLLLLLRCHLLKEVGKHHVIPEVREESGGFRHLDLILGLIERSQTNDTDNGKRSNVKSWAWGPFTHFDSVFY